MKKLQVTTLLIYLFAFTAINTNAQTQGAGYALDFDGSSDYIDCGVNDILNIEELTVSAWIKTRSTIPESSPRAIMSRWNTGSGGRSWLFRVFNGNLMFYVNTGGTTKSCSTPLPLNKWVYVTATFDKKKIKLYINGNLKSSTSLTGAIKITDSKFFIGVNDNKTNFFDGILDEARLWNRALTETEIRNNMNKPLTGNEPGLVAYYRMNEGENGTCEDGKDVCDKSGKGNHGEKK